MFNPLQPFTRGQALEAGVSAGQLRGPRYKTIFHGVHIAREVVVKERHRIIAGLMLHPPEAQAFASHLSAAAIYGVAVPDHSDVHISVTDPKHRRWVPGIKPHVAPDGTRTVTWYGVHVSDPARLMVELASLLDLVELVAAGDSLLRKLDIEADVLRAALDEMDCYWAPAARAAAAYLRDGVDSPMESRLRMLIVLAGLPEPTVNHRVYDAFGTLLMRYDLSYPHLRIIVEYDGRHHVEVIEQWEHDSEREGWIDDAEWRRIKVISKGIYVTPAATLDRVAKALRRAGECVPPLRDDWRAFFPGREPVKRASA